MTIKSQLDGYTRDDLLRDEERYLIDQIIAIQDAYFKQVEPYAKRLASLRALQAQRPVIIRNIDGAVMGDFNLMPDFKLEQT